MKALQILILILFAHSIKLPADSIPQPEEAPQIAGFSPLEGTAGSVVVIRGTAILGATAVTFNGVEATFTILADALTATVPKEATTGPISITTPGGVAVSTENFTVITLAPPSITSFSPLQAGAGAAVSIEGENLRNVTSVQFNGVEATFSQATGSLTAVVPVSATTGPITIKTEAGTAVSSESFTVLQQNPPVITSFTPAAAPAGATVEIQGTDLVNVTAVQFNGVPASFLTFAGMIRATVPFNATSGPITVATPAGTNTTAATFTVTLGPLPIISGFTPSTGGPGDMIEIQGSYLRDIVSVQFNGAEASFTNSLFRPLTAIVPTNALTGPITVTTRAGSATSSESFVVVNPLAPAIDSFSPLSARKGDVIQVFGTNLTGVVNVEFGAASASFIEFTADRLLVIVPENASAGPIKVMTGTGVAISEQEFTPGVDPEPEPEPEPEPNPVEPPLISVQLVSASKAQLSWPVAAGFRLEMTGSLTPPVEWSAVAVIASDEQGRSTVLLDIESSVRFFRLAAP